MDINYSYKINLLEVNPSLNGLNDVITRVHFTYTGTDSISGHSGSFQGITPIENPNPETFISFNNLTEAEVIEWVKISHPLEHMQEQITKQIELLINQTQEYSTMPWNPPIPN